MASQHGTLLEVDRGNVMSLIVVVDLDWARAMNAQARHEVHHFYNVAVHGNNRLTVECIDGSKYVYNFDIVHRYSLTRKPPHE